MIKVTEIEGFSGDLTFREAMILIFRTRIEEMFLNSDELFNDENTEALHQMRVAARRVQGYMKIFRNYFPKKKFNIYYGLIRNFIKTIGITRELDVTADIIEKFIKTRPDEDNKILILFIAKIKNEKTTLRDLLSKNENVLKFLDSRDEIMSFTDEFLKWKQKKGKTGFNLDNSFKENALPVLTKLHRQVLKYKPLVLYHPFKKMELHRIRIKAKPLRYTLELYSDIFGEEFNKIITEYKSFVEKTGTIHDIDVLIPKLNDFLNEIRIYNKNIPGRERILLKPIFLFLKKLRERRRKQFGIICEDLSNWGQESFSAGISELIVKSE